MSPPKSYLILPILLLSLLHSALAVSDENICEVQCQYCCREKQCRSQDECKGNFTPFVILGIVAGAIVGLLILVRLYKYLKGKAPKKDPNKKRTRIRSKSPKPAKASKSKPKKSGKSNKEEKSQSRQEIYLQIDNESIVGVESNIPKEDKKTSSKNDVTSKSVLVLADDKGKETNRSDKKGESLVPKPSNGTSKNLDKDKGKDKDKENKDKGKDKDKGKGKDNKSSTSKKPAASGSKPSGSSKMTSSSASGVNKERGRSTGASGKERSGSQKKGESSVGKDKMRESSVGKDKMKSSTVSKK